jgi:hypothetical protein
MAMDGGTAWHGFGQVKITTGHVSICRLATLPQQILAGRSEQELRVPIVIRAALTEPPRPVGGGGRGGIYPLWGRA